MSGPIIRRVVKSSSQLRVGIDLTAFALEDFDDVVGRASEQDGDVVIDLGNGDTLELAELQVAQLHSDDFLV